MENHDWQAAGGFLCCVQFPKPHLFWFQIFKLLHLWKNLLFFPPYCLITCFIYSESKSSHYRSPSGGLNWSCCFNSDSTWDCGFCSFACLGSRLQCGGCRGEDSAVQTSSRLRAVAAAADRLRRAAGWRPHWGHRFRLVFEVYRGRWTLGEIWWYYMYLICLGDI